MATQTETLARMQEIANRGIQDQLPGDKKAIFDEAVRRGLVVLPQVETVQPQAVQQSQPEPTAEPQAPRLPGRMGRAQELRQERRDTQSLLARFEAGLITSQDMTPEEVENVRKARIDAIPEITGSFKQLSENLGVTEALAGMTTFDPDEFGAILSAADPSIAVVTTPEGERIAINRETNEAFSINKSGPSLMDALQIGGAAAVFTPSGAVSGIARQAGGAALTQAAIEAGQTTVGGEFDPAEVALAGAAVPVVGGVVKAGKAAVESFRRSVRASTPLIDPVTETVTPQFQKALAKYNIDAGALVDDHANLPVIYSGDKPEKVVKDIVTSHIKTGKPAKYTASLRLDHKGNIVDDDLGKIALSQGFEGGDIAAAKNANKPTRKLAQKMLRMQRAILADSSNVDKFRPSDVVGDSVMDRFRYVRQEADKLADQLNKMASRELTVSGRKLLGANGDRLKGLDIDPKNVQQAANDALERLFVKIPKEVLEDKVPIYEAVQAKDFFDGSDIMKDPTSQKIIRDAFDLLSYDPGGPIDAFRAHRVKRQIDSMIDFNKKSSEGLTESGRRFAKAIRASLNDSIREVSPKYAKVNDDLSMAIQALNAVEDSMGRRTDLFDTGANQQLGTEMRKLMSNYGVRQTMNNSLNQLDSAASKLGGSFNTNYRELNRFANVLDRRFGSVSAQTSFKGNIDAALDLNRLRSTSVREAVIEAGLKATPVGEALGKVADKLGPNDQKAFDVMNKILSRGK